MHDLCWITHDLILLVSYRGTPQLEPVEDFAVHAVFSDHV